MEQSSSLDYVRHGSAISGLTTMVFLILLGVCMTNSMTNELLQQEEESDEQQIDTSQTSQTSHASSDANKFKPLYEIQELNEYLSDYLDEDSLANMRQTNQRMWYGQLTRITQDYDASQRYSPGHIPDFQQLYDFATNTTYQFYRNVFDFKDIGQIRMAMEFERLDLSTKYGLSSMTQQDLQDVRLTNLQAAMDFDGLDKMFRNINTGRLVYLQQPSKLNFSICDTFNPMYMPHLCQTSTLRTNSIPNLPFQEQYEALTALSLQGNQFDGSISQSFREMPQHLSWLDLSYSKLHFYPLDFRLTARQLKYINIKNVSAFVCSNSQAGNPGLTVDGLETAFMIDGDSHSHGY